MGKNFTCQTFHELSNEWGGRSREGEARAKPGNQLVDNTTEMLKLTTRLAKNSNMQEGERATIDGCLL